MAENINDIPEDVFDWLHVHDFEALNLQQQKTVLQYLSEAEYTTMRQTATGIKTLHSEPVVVSADAKQKLMQRFDEVHSSKSIVYPMLRYWQAAAAVLFLLSAGLAYLLMHQLKTTSNVYAYRQVDTVVVKEPVALSADTVYTIAKQEKQPLPVAKKKPQKAVVTKPESKQVSPVQVTDLGAINIVSVKEIDKPTNATKGGSMKDDTLIKKYSFVSL